MNFKEFYESNGVNSKRNSSGVLVGIDTSKGDFTGSDNPRAAGNFLPKTWKSSEGILLKLSTGDKALVKAIKLKPNQEIFRYTTDATKISGQEPLVKIDKKNGMVYFLTDKANELGDVEFEKQGIKTLFMNLFK